MAKTLDELEQTVPTWAIRAVRTAYKKARAAGLSVLVGDNGTLYEVRPDGTRVAIKKLRPEVRVQRGRRIRVK